VDNDGGEPYGYAGEWWEDDLSLLYLRARWYLPQDGVFLSRDPVESEPPYLYVWGNPVIFIDPSGMQCPGCRPEPDATATPEAELETPEPGPVPTPILEGTPTPPSPPRPINPLLLAHNLPSVLKQANGYVEGKVTVFSAVACVWQITGEEIVYDFETRERQKFTYTHAKGYQKGVPIIPPGLAFSVVGGSKAAYGGFLWGFTERGIEQDYSGYFVGTSLGINASIFSKLVKQAGAGPGVGWGQFMGHGNTPFGAITGKGDRISGQVVYFSMGAELSKQLFGKSSVLKWPVDATFAGTWYTPAKDTHKPYDPGQELQILEDVKNGNGSPVQHVPLMLATGLYDPDIRNMGAAVGANVFIRKGWIAPAE
jgi:RHS repeat-associated protein